jgi:hypothetical protein
MTQQSFLIYTHFLVDELQEYSHILPLPVAGERFLLILDGLTSMFTYEAIRFLESSRKRGEIENSSSGNMKIV